MLDGLPARFRARANFIRERWETVEKTMELAKVKNLRDSGLKAKRLATALADLKRAPSYALQQWEEKRPQAGKRSTKVPLKPNEPTPPALTDPVD
jgi:hypothetical protein